MSTEKYAGEKHGGGPPGTWEVWIDRLRFPDWKAGAVVIGSIVFLVLLLGVLPRWLQAQEESDFRNVPAQTVPGVVTIINISPVSQGGTGLFNAVTVAFANKQAYYALTQRDQWKPSFHQNVRVTYQIGRHSGQVRVIEVQPQ